MAEQTPTPVATTNTPAESVFTRHPWIIPLGALIVGAAVPTLTYYQFFNKAAPKLIAVPQIAPLLTPPGMIDENGFPTFTKPPEGPERRLTQQILISVSNNGTMKTTNVRLLTHRSIDRPLLVAIEKEGKLIQPPGLATSTIDIGDLDVASQVNLYFWASDAITPGTTWTLADETGSSSVPLVKTYTTYHWFRDFIITVLPAIVMYSFLHYVVEPRLKKLVDPTRH